MGQDTFSKLILKVETGLSNDGKILKKSRMFHHLNPLLSDEDALAIGNGLSNLQKYKLHQLAKQDTKILSAE